jgi:hypothetical protein
MADEHGTERTEETVSERASRSRGPIVASGKDGSMDEAFYSERE